MGGVAGLVWSRGLSWGVRGENEEQASALCPCPLCPGSGELCVRARACV